MALTDALPLHLVAPRPDNIFSLKVRATGGGFN